MKTFRIIALMCGGLSVVLGAACSGDGAKTAHDAIVLANDACVVVRDVAPDSSVPASICVKENELVPYMNLILGARKRTTSPVDASVDGGKSTAASSDARSD